MDTLLLSIINFFRDLMILILLRSLNLIGKLGDPLTDHIFGQFFDLVSNILESHRGRKPTCYKIVAALIS